MMTESCETRCVVDHHGRSHVLLELSTAEDLSIPLRGSARLRYTCLSVSRRYIALGCNTGAVYIFGKNSLKHLQVVLAEKDSSPVTQVSLGPIDNLLAYSCSNGNIIVVALNIECREKPDRVRLCSEHVGASVTALQWDISGTRLFAGDSLGKVSVAFVPSSKAKDLFKLPSEPIARFDSAVVQLDWSDDRLLVSTMTKCYLCNTTRQQYSQIGKRLRDGQFGACFFPKSDGQTPTIYCSRPGSRVWEVDFDGSVLNTHQFKQLLAIPSFPVVSLGDTDVAFPDMLESGKAQSLPFPKLLMISEHYLLTWNKHGMYIFDPVAVKVVTWTNQIKGITSIMCLKNEVFIFNEMDSQVQRLHLFSVDRCVSVLIAKQQWLLAGIIAAYFESLLKDVTVSKHLPWTSLSDLHEHLIPLGAMELSSKVKDILDAMHACTESDSDDRSHDIVRLESGIYQVNNRKRRASDDSLHTPSSSQSLSRRSSVNSLTAMVGEQLPSSKTDTGTPETPEQTVDSPLTTANDKEPSLIAQSFVFSNTSVDSDLPSASSNSNHTSQLLDILTFHHEKNITQTSKTDTSSITSDTEVTGSIDITKDEIGSAIGDGVNGAIIGDEVPKLPNNENVGVEHEAEVQSVAELESPVLERVMRLDSPLPMRVTRTGSISSLSSISSNEFTVEQLIPEPMAIVAKSETSGKKMLRKKRASQPVILGPGEKIDVKGPVRRTLSADSARKYSIRRRAKSDLGSPSAIQEAILETDKQEPALQEKTTPDGVEPKTSSTPQSSLPVHVPAMTLQHSPSPSRRETRDPSPSDSPLTQSWEGELGEHTAPSKTILKSVKDSLSLKFSSTRKNFMKTIREKKNILKDSISGTSPLEERVPIYVQDQTNKESKMLKNQERRGKTVETETDSDIKPLIDMTDLQHATHVAIRAMDKPEVVLDPDRARTMLSTWLTHLHTALQQLITIQHRDRVKRERERLEGERDRLQEKSDQQEKRGNHRIERQGGVHIEDSVDNELIGHGGNSGENGIARDPDNEDTERNKDDIEKGRTEQSDKAEQLKRLGAETNNIHETTILAEMITSREVVLYREGELLHTKNTPAVKSHEKEADTISIDSGLPVFESHNAGEEETSDTEGGQADLSQGEQGEMVSSMEGDSVVPLSSYSSGHSGSYTGSPDTYITESAHAGEDEPILPNKNCDSNSEAFRSSSDPPSCDTEADVNFSFDSSQIMFVTDPFQAGKDLCAIIAKLVNYSFELGIHNDVSQYLFPLTKHTYINPQSMDTGTAIQTRNSTTDPSHEALSYSFSLAPAGNDVEILNNPSPDMEENDHELSMFIRCYFSFLDIKRVRKSFSCHNLHCYQTWLALVDCLKEVGKKDSVSTKLTENNTNSAFDLLRSGILPNRDAILGHVSRLFEVSVSRTVEYCLEEVTQVQPVDVLYLCRTYQKPTQQVFLSYMLKRLVLMGAVPQSVKLAELCGNKEVRLAWLTCLLEHSHSPHLHHKHGQPVPGSHLHLWKNRSTIDAILQQFMSTDGDQFLELCQNNGYWLGLLELLKSRDRQQALQLIVRLGDISLLAAEGCCPESREEWQCVVQAMVTEATHPNDSQDGQRSSHDQSDTNGDAAISSIPGQQVSDKVQSGGTEVARAVDDNDWSPSLTWDSVALLLAQSVGPTNAIGLLENISLPDNALSLSFYQAMIVSTLTAKWQSDADCYNDADSVAGMWAVGGCMVPVASKRSLLHGILEKTDAYLWARKPTQMAPQLLYAVEEETKTVAVGKEGRQTQVFKDMFTQLESQPDVVTYRFVEDPECHWGIASNINSECPCCGLALTEQVSLSQPGLVIFHCGHGFHKFCHEEKTCTMCSDKLGIL